MVSILKDNLGDPDPSNDRLRQVWAFGYRHPTLLQRVAASIPFFYRRAPEFDLRTRIAPKPVLDLASPAQGMVPKILESLLQSAVLDPLGTPYRASTRAYRERTSEYRTMHVWRAVEALSNVPPGSEGLSPDEVARVQGRLILSNRLFGGWVSEHAAAVAWDKRQREAARQLGHNWELLRQRVEENGLYFQPLAAAPAGSQPEFAIVWMEQNSATPGDPAHFEGKFLSIADPYKDRRIAKWKGYSETWYFDAAGLRVDPGASGARPAHMIPLALYALDYPRVPLLLVDFRSSGKPKRREMALRFSDDLATGVLGFTGYGNLPYMAAKQSWFFVHGRHGAPTDRAARVRAYVQLRQALATELKLDPALRAELIARAQRLDFNPFDEDDTRETRTARAQYQALIQSSDRQFRALLDRERAHELAGSLHSPAALFGMRAASIASFGIYRHREPMTNENLAQLDTLRRSAWQQAQQETGLPPAQPASRPAAGGQ